MPPPARIILLVLLLVVEGGGGGGGGRRLAANQANIVEDPQLRQRLHDLIVVFWRVGNRVTL